MHDRGKMNTAKHINLLLLHVVVILAGSFSIGSVAHNIEWFGQWFLIAVSLLWSVPIWAVGIAWGYRSGRRREDIVYVYLFALAYCAVGGFILGDHHSVSRVERVMFFSVVTPAVCGISAAIAQYWFGRCNGPDVRQPRSNRNDLLRIALGTALFIVLRYSVLVAMAGIAYQYGDEWRNRWWYTPLFFEAIWLSSSYVAAGLLGALSAYPLERTMMLSAAVSFTADMGWMVNMGMSALVGSLVLLSALVGSYPWGCYVKSWRSRYRA